MPNPETSNLNVDPVCGMRVDPNAKEQATFQGQTYKFCSTECREKFEQSPQRYVSNATQPHA
jgi:P-type Cu+ transporter